MEDWTQITFEVPPEETQKILEFAKTLGFKEIDWCVMQREKDFARVDYAPCDPSTSSGYTIDPFGRA